MNELNPLSLFTFSAPSGDTEIVAGRYQITIKAGKFQVNGEVLKTDDIKEGDFIKLNPRSREVEINGRSVGKVPTPKAPDAGDKSAKPK